jgi:hypothetical protein
MAAVVLHSPRAALYIAYRPSMQPTVVRVHTLIDVKYALIESGDILEATISAIIYSVF